MSYPSIAIFISYARNEPDTAFVDRLEKDLQVQGFRTWVDRSKLEGGQNWREEIEKAIDRCPVLLVVLSNDAIKSDYVKMEYRYAQDEHKVVIPVQHRHISEKIPIDLRVLQRIDFQRNYSQGIKDLLAALRPSVPPPTTSPLQKYDREAWPLPLSPQAKGLAWIHPPLALRSQGSIRIALIVFIILFIGGGFISFLAFKGSIFKGSPTATHQSTPQTQNTVTTQGTGQPQNTVTTTASGLKLAWTYTTKGHIEESSPVVANGMVYIGSLDHKLYALDAKSGAFRWAYTTAGPIRSSPAVNDGMVYVGSLDHNLYALDALSGAKKWSYSTGAGIYSSPVVANGILYFGSDDGNLYALDARSGAKKWLYSTTAQIVSTPAVANGTVYFGSADYNLYAIDAKTGNELGSYATGGSILSSPLVVLPVTHNL